MCEDVDLYDDLPVLNFGESITKIEEERQYFKEQLSEREKDLHEVKEELIVLRKDKKVLEENISSLYKTAVNEIKRKDKLIEDLRREKDSIIFRRKGRLNCNVNSTPYTLKSKERILHGENNSEESQKIISCENSWKESDEQILKTPENFSCEKKSFSRHKQNSGIKDVLNNYSDQKDCAQIVDVSLDSVSSWSSHLTSNRSKSPEPSCAKKSDYERERRSLSSENKSEKKYRQIDNSSAHHTRNGTPHSKWKYHERSRRDDHHGYYGENGNYYRDEGYSRKGRKVHSNEEFDGTYYTPSRRNTTQKLSKMLSPSKRYTENRHVRSKSGRNTIKQSHNVRIATQLKSKYSRTFRERSVSCTPVKRKGFMHKKWSPDSKSLKSPTVLCKKQIKAKHFDNERSRGSEITDKPVPKRDVRNKLQFDCPLYQNHGCDHCKKSKLSELSTSEQNVEETEVLDYASSSKHSNEAQCKELSAVKSGFKRKHDRVSDNECNSQQNKSKEDTKLDESISQSECALCKNKGCIKCKVDNTSESSPKQSLVNEVKVHLSSKEKRCAGELPPRHSITPPSKNFIILNISPSFEDPAVVEENKFSHCVFNEQCEFKRRKRKKFKKLLATETKSDESGDVKEKECSELSNGQNSEKNSTEQQTFHPNQQDKSDSVEDCVSDKKVSTINAENTIVKDLTKANNISSLKEIDTNEISIVSNCSEVDVDTQKTAVLTQNTSCELPKDKLLRHKTPNKKRKLDSICEELKANLEKKNVAESVVVVPSCSNDDQLNTTAAVVSNDTPNRIVLSRRRRRVPNLQDNVVQVLTQIKSTTP